ncbi:MAG: DUF1553 domain-containing protein [Gemmataceae bacterium]|nr:DUF1553 domain-containing protein [Gemmataceae bacterium]
MARLFSLIACLLLAHSAFGQAIQVSPASIEMRHPRHQHSLQVMAATPDGFTLDLRGDAKFASANAKVATVDGQGTITPVADGETAISVTANGQTKTVAIKVKLPAAEPPTSFKHEVMPILSRAGCNMGACHGYSLGKNGFKLSLRGQDGAADYLSIARDSSARRVNFLDPQGSLLVAKARGDVSHEGGTRFRAGSLSDRVLMEWIRHGVPSDLSDKSEVIRVRMVPDKLVLRPGQKHRLQLIADYDDGISRDVTKFAVLTVNNPLHGETDDDATFTAGELGETAVVARYERVFAAASVLVLKPSAAEFKPTPVGQGHLVDRHVIEKLNRLKIMPSALATDEEFLRRVHLDLIGVQPTPEEVKTFLAEKDSKKREKAIDALFQRPEFIDHWSLKWGDLLQNSRNTASSQAVYLLREFVRGAVASNMRADEFARRLLTAQGGAVDDPASVYLAQSKDANDTVERVTQVFCGVRMLCARCHSHPMENWTQGDYYGIASFFNQVSTRQDSRLAQVPNAKLLSLNLAAGFAGNPRTGQPQSPRFLGGAEPKFDKNVDRRQAYATWLTAKENPMFARALVNRIWSYFFHRGIIDPVDDIRSTNPPINPELLDALTKDFIDAKFDLRHLMRRIATSETYQRRSVPNASNKHDEQNFSRAVPRRIPAEALLDSLVQATGVAESFSGAPGGFRAAQLPDGNVENAVLKLFGKPQRMDACECERDNGSNMLQALHFINGKSIMGRISAANARPALLVAKKLDDTQLVTELYLWSLARHPNDRELRLGLDFLKSQENRGEAAQDLMWALLNSKDFLLSP